MNNLKTECGVSLLHAVCFRSTKSKRFIWNPSLQFAQNSPPLWGYHCSGSSSVHPRVLDPLSLHLSLCVSKVANRFTFPPFSPRTPLFHLIWCACVWPFVPSSPSRGTGGGDGEFWDGGSPRETETPAQTQRAVPVTPAGVPASYSHQVHRSKACWD